MSPLIIDMSGTTTSISFQLLINNRVKCDPDRAVRSKKCSHAGTVQQTAFLSFESALWRVSDFDSVFQSDTDQTPHIIHSKGSRTGALFSCVCFSLSLFTNFY